MSVSSVDAEIRSPFGDALLLMDEATVKTLDDPLFRALTIVLDPEGRTDITDDFPGEPWAQVWRREGEPIWALCRAGRLLIDLLERGNFHIKAFDGSLVEAGVQVNGPVTVGRLVLRGPTIGLISGIEWMRRKTLGPLAGTYRSIKSSAGEHPIEIGHAPAPVGWNRTSGMFWAPDSPAIIVGVGTGPLNRVTTNVFRTRNADLIG